MMATSCYPLVAREAGLPRRYVYWYGRSGRRYLFTAVEAAAMADFTDAVAVAVRGGAVAWAGQGPALAEMGRTARLGGADLYVHLLAASPEERRAVVADLRPAPPAHLKIAA